MSTPAPAHAPRLYVGTCGFSYKDWVGAFYPSGMKPADMLDYYAKSFGAVEIDSTYYAIPKPALFESMDRRTPAEFRFTVKAPGSVTHVPADAEMPIEDARAFADCLRPLASAGKLGAVLLQFPGSFRPSRDASQRLYRIRDAWPELPLVAEFRHREWQSSEALEMIRDLGFGWCNVDEPRFSSLPRPGAEVTSPVGYVRLHGRNAAAWWADDRSPGARYDYLYNTRELEEWVPRIADVAGEARETYVFFNNHRLGKAAKNAAEMSDLLRLPRPAPPPRDELRLL